MIKLIDTLTFCILIYFACLWVGYTFFLLGTFLTVIRKYKESKYNSMIAKLNAEPMLPVSIIIPAFNESKRITHAIDALLKLDYKNIHIILVNDGSTDDTLALLIKNYALQKVPPAFMIKHQTGTVLDYYHASTIPHMIVIDKEHSPFANSAADCINAGLNVCRTPLYMTVDADTILEPAALTRMLFMYLTHPHCLAIGGNIYVPDA
ncbi:MAG: glycosyltransferase family 2 protein, partial [Legionellaceae bacterium]